MNKINEKFKKDELKVKRITNNDLTCKDCRYRLDDDKLFGNTSKCLIFPQIKPNEVLKGNDCPEKKKEES